MRMTSNKRENFGELRSQRDDILCEIIAATPRLQAYVACEHDRICAVPFCFDHRVADWFDRLFKTKIANEFRPKPERHSRRRHSNDRDSDSIELFQNASLYLR